MATLQELIADKRNFPDEMELQVGATTFKVGQLRAIQEAAGADAMRALDTERARLAKQEQELNEARLAVAASYEKINNFTPPSGPMPPTPSWMDDPFFAPLAKDYKVLDQKYAQSAEEYRKLQAALATGIKYIADRWMRSDYESLPEDFRKEIPLQKAVALANERRYFDDGGLADIKKVYGEWQAPRERQSIEKKIREEVEREYQDKLVAASLPRPGSAPMPPPVRPADAPKDMRDSFNRLKQSPTDAGAFYNSLLQAAGVGTPQ